VTGIRQEAKWERKSAVQESELNLCAVNREEATDRFDLHKQPIIRKTFGISFPFWEGALFIICRF
jgi:hypothetical protein